VYAGERLSFTCIGKASRGKAKVKTGIGKSDFPGLQGGPRKRDHVSLDEVRALRLYPDSGPVFCPGFFRDSSKGCAIRQRPLVPCFFGPLFTGPQPKRD